MTNPDNVGGLPELPEPIRMGLNDAIPFGGYYTADQMRAYGELCRAAPAGGAPICPECKAPGLLFECVACSHSNYPKDSAPAGSGEVEALVQKWRDESESGFDGDGNLSDTWTAQAKRACADELTALLRKLQQGADIVPTELAGNGLKVEAGFVYADGVHTPTILISFPPNDFDYRDRFWRGIVAASQGQEGGHASVD